MEIPKPLLIYLPDCMRSNSSGFTLIELLVSLGIFILLVVPIVTIFLTASNTKNIVFEQLNVQNQSRKVVQDFVNEIRGANYSSIGAYPLEQASSSQIVFYTNLYHNSYLERVRYFLVTTTLYKGVIVPTGTPILSYPTSTEVITDVLDSIASSSSTLFTYYDQNFTGVESSLAQPVNTSLVRIVKIFMTIDKNPLASPNSFTIQAKTEFRNLKSN